MRLNAIPLVLFLSPVATLLEFEFDGELLAPGSVSTFSARSYIEDNVRTAGPAFDARYEALSTRADLITYNGHAGLGANVRALARKGRFVANQYVIVFMNSSDTFAYVDGALAQSRAPLNRDDPNGTKHLEIVTNGMPAYFSSMPNGSLALLRGLMKVDAPLTYDQMFANVDRAQVVNVTGEEDNVYYPAHVDAWTGLDESSTVSKSASKQYSTPTLPAGTYVFTLTGTGDADLYVRIGVAPTTAAYDCRPYKNGTNEQCVVNLTTPAPVHVMVRGYATTSTFRIVGMAQ